jgi:3-phenylpropionate/cinnamic acid dioxygenase small subunit
VTPEEFLYHEAALLDERRFDEWLALYADDAIYWIPQGDEPDPNLTVSIAYDDRRRLHERVLRLASGFAHAQDPPSRTCHLVGNPRVASASDGELRVTSNLMVAEVRRSTQNIYAARVEHRLVPTDETFLIRRKVIWLLNRDAPLGNVSFLI